LAGKILVIEDDPKFTKILLDALQPEGYEILTTADGQEGIQFFEDCHPDLILLDGQIPKLDGFQVCQVIRQDIKGKSVPIIMMTAVYQVQSMEDMARKELGVQEYLYKPINLKNLKTLIHGFLCQTRQSKTSP